MTGALPAPPLLVITDRHAATRALSLIVTDIVQAGCRWLMVREKDLDSAALVELTKTLAGRTRPANAQILVNGNVDAAKAAGAAGVHLQSWADIAAARAMLGNNSLIGVSAHNLGDARAAQDAGANYITLSPVFATESKPGYGPALGTGGLAALCGQVTIPVIALAGINPANAADCLDAGAAGIAVMGSVMRSELPASVVSDLLRAIAR